MPGHRTCARGHTWPADDAGPGDTLCPVCGEPALAEADSPQTLLLRGRRDVTSPLAPPTAATLPIGNGVSNLASWPEVPGYEVLGELGRGGMGVVYKATQLALSRVVALKMIHTGAGADPDQLTRLKAEAEAIARLQHPNIIQVFEVGTCPAGQYLVMEFASGGSLARRLDGIPQPPRLAARLVETLAQAVHAAHERGVIHRDIKPGNVQVLEDDSVPLDSCTLKISDFGLARRLDEAAGLTLSGQVLGTPGYMPPEQARRSGAAVGPAADIYALGVMLYEALTGRPPFRGSTAMETVHLMLSLEPLPPSRLRRQLPRDLETITLKCLHKDPARRYIDARALADDLARFLSGRPIQARPTPAWERAGMWARRQPVTAALAAASAGFVLLSFCLVAWQWYRAEAAHGQSERQREQAERLAGAEARSRREAQTLAARLLLERGARLCEAGDPPGGLLWLARSLDAAPVEDGGLQRSLRHLIGGWAEHLHLFRHHHRLAGPARVIAYSRDGKTLAAASGPSVLLAEADTGRRVAEVNLPGDVIHINSGQSGLVAASRVGAGLRLVALPSGLTLGPDVTPPAPPRCAALAPDGSLLLVGCDDGRARLYRVETGRQVGGDWPHAGAVRAAAFGPGGRVAITGSNDQLARLWDVASGRLLRELRDHTRPVVGVAFRPDGQLVATAGEDRKAVVWDAADGLPRQRFLGHERDVFSVALHATEPIVATASEDGTAQLWGLVTGRAIGAAVRHDGEVNVVAFHPAGELFATGGDDGTVRVWRRGRPSRLDAPLPHEDAVRSLAVHPDGKSALAGGSRGGLLVWDLATGRPRAVAHPSTVMRVAYSPDGKTFLTGQYNGNAQLYDSNTLQPLGAPWKHGDAVLAVAFSPDGRLVATGCEDKDLAIRLRDVATGRLVRTLTGHSRKVVSLAFSPDGRRLASASWDRTVRLWDVGSGEPAGPPLPHLDLVQAVAFSPDGALLLTGSDDFLTRLWDTATGRLNGAPLRHPDKVQSVAFSPDGAVFATGDKAGRVVLREARIGKPLGTAVTHTGEVHSLVFTPDGTTLLSGGWEGLVHRLRVPAATRRSPPNLRGWLETQTGQALEDPGVLSPLGVEDWQRRATDPANR